MEDSGRLDLRCTTEVVVKRGRAAKPEMRGDGEKVLGLKPMTDPTFIIRFAKNRKIEPII